jgi:hypothetical protein
MSDEDLIEQLRQRQANGRVSYITYGELVAMVPTDQLDAWRVVLAKARAADRARDAAEEGD